MKFEDLVKEYKQVQFKIRRTDLQEKEIRALNGFPQSAGENGMPKTKQNSSSVENLAVRLDEISKTRKSLQQKITGLREQIFDLIDLIPNLMSREIVESKIFTSNCGWKYIASKCGFCESYCRLLYRDGVNKINERMKDNEI